MIKIVNGSRISIPELEEMGMSYEESFRMIRLFIKHYIIHLSELHSSISIDDIKAYSLQIVKRIEKTSTTLNTVIERDNDYVVSNIIIRSLADSIASFILIYEESDCNLKRLRHYLYVIDGFNGRLKQLPDQIRNDDKLKTKEFVALDNQIKNAKANYSEVIRYSSDCIKSLSIYNGYSHSIDELIKFGNWKFKSLGSNNSNKNRYSWNELHTKLNLNSSSDIFLTQSEFVHGLSTSNLIYDNEVGSFEPIYAISVSLLGRLIKSINVVYSKDIDIIKPKMLSMLSDTDMPDSFINYLLNQFKNDNII